MLSCSCPEWDDEAWFYMVPDDFSTLKRKRAVRCRSCGKLVKPGDECIEFERKRGPRTDIEERIMGDEIPMASWYQCASCGEMYLNLNAYGYCISPDENVFTLLKEHQNLIGWNKK